jgi:Polyprenyl synthetase
MTLSLDPSALRIQRARALAYLNALDMRFGSVLEQIMRYAFESADPLCASLALWACDACGGDSKTMLPIAASIECLHRFAVLHDELEDGNVLEGDSSTSSKWGLAQTLNAGDAFHAVALRMLGIEAYYPDRALAAGVMLTNTMLRRIEQRSRLAASARAGTSPVRRSLRAASEATWTMMLAASMHAGAICAGAPEALGATFSRAGRSLGITLQLAAASDSRLQEYARRYAEKAVTEVERSALGQDRIHDFREIAHHFAAGIPTNGDRL